MNPFEEILTLTETAPQEGRTVLVTGRVLTVSPLTMEIGELVYDAEDLHFLAHVPLPRGPEDIGESYLLLTMDSRQTYYVLGRC